MSDINVNFTINQLNANLSIDPAPNVTLNVADPMTANFFIEGTTGATAAGNTGEIQFNTAGDFDSSPNLTFNSGILRVGQSGTIRLSNGISANDTVITGSTYSLGSGLANTNGLNFAFLGSDGGTGNTNGGSLSFQAGSGVGSGSGADVLFAAGLNGSSTSTGNIELATFNTTLKIHNTGAISINGNTGNAGQVLTSSGNSSSPTWNNVAAVTNVATTGSGLGFSLSGGPITNTGTITLTTPTDTALRASLNIGNVANINLNGNGSQVLAGNGAWVAQTGGGGGGFSGNILSSSIQVTQAAEVYGGTNILIPFPATAPMAYKIRWWCYGSSGTAAGQPGSGFARMRLRIGPNGNLSDAGSVSVERQIFSQTWSGEWTILVLRNNQFRICFEGWNGDPVNFPQMTTTSNMGWISNSTNATATTITQPTYIGFSGSVFNAIPDAFGNYPFFWFADAIAYRIL